MCWRELCFQQKGRSTKAPVKLTSSPSLNSRLDPIPGSPIHDDKFNQIRPLPPPSKKFVRWMLSKLMPVLSVKIVLALAATAVTYIKTLYDIYHDIYGTVHIMIVCVSQCDRYHSVSFTKWSESWCLCHDMIHMWYGDPKTNDTFYLVTFCTTVSVFPRFFS